ncbi:MAG: hypothetical protein IKL65_05860 [Bacilli bacterium]|nr:hypothetical protein [Bacilli bacterium]
MMFLVDNFEMSGLYKCGSLGFEFSGTFPYLVSTAILIIKIVVPILLIIFGMLDLGKAVVASKEDEIKKGQQTFIKRVIAAVIVFFVIQIVQILINFISGDKNISECFNCFVNGKIADNACISTSETLDM